MNIWTSWNEHSGATELLTSTIFLLIAAAFLLIGPGTSLAKSPSVTRPYYHIPPNVKKTDLSFAGSRIPIERHDVAVRIEDQINYLLMDRRASLMEILERLSIYGPLISASLAEEKLPKDLLYLSATLSELNATSRTKSGGLGWWSLGSTKIGNQSWASSNEWDDRRDPLISTKLAAGIFNQIRTRNPKLDYLLLIAAFVDGSEKIEALAKKNPGFSYWEVLAPHFSETIIPRAVALKIINENRKYYDIDVPSPPALAFDLVDKQKLVKDLPLRVVSEWTGATPRAIWELNPGVDSGFGAIVKFDKRYPYSTFIRAPKGYGNKVRSLMDSGGFSGN